MLTELGLWCLNGWKGELWGKWTKSTSSGKKCERDLAHSSRLSHINTMSHDIGRYWYRSTRPGGLWASWRWEWYLRDRVRAVGHLTQLRLIRHFFPGLAPLKTRGELHPDCPSPSHLCTKSNCASWNPILDFLHGILSASDLIPLCWLFAQVR